MTDPQKQSGDFASPLDALSLAIRAISEGSQALILNATVAPSEVVVAELERRAAAVRTLRRLHADLVDSRSDCRRCADEKAQTLPRSIERLMTVKGMFVCPTCGNKRCPKASDHRNACSGSNEPGQVGSTYGAHHFGSSEQGS